MQDRFPNRTLTGALLAVVAMVMLVVGGCSVADSVFRQPLPPSETLALEAILLEGGGMLPGTQVVRIGWNPPDENAEADLIVIERSVNAKGPWEEIAAKLPATGYHEATATFRHGNFYYFRAFMTRGNEETEPAEPISVWIPDVGALERTAPGVVVPANSTPTPVPGSDVPPTPFPTPSGDTVSALHGCSANAHAPRDRDADAVSDSRTHTNTNGLARH